MHHELLRTRGAADTALWVERQNVKALKAYAETIKKALDAKAREAEALRAECERLRAEASTERRGQS
jgi:prefoldin subunit 5